MTKAPTPVTITEVYYSPDEDTVIQTLKGEPDSMPRFFIRGTYGTKRFSCFILCELEDRDIEYEHWSGVNMDPSEHWARWDALTEVLFNSQSFLEAHNKASKLYFQQASSEN